MPIGSAMALTCLASATTWVLLLGFLEESLSPGFQIYYGSLHSTSGHGVSNTYWSELQGMHAILLAVYSICQAFSLPSGMVTLGCNNIGILSQLCYPKRPSPAFANMPTCSWLAGLSTFISPSRMTLCMLIVAKTPTYPLRLWIALLSLIQWPVTLPNRPSFGNLQEHL